MKKMYYKRARFVVGSEVLSNGILAFVEGGSSIGWVSVDTDRWYPHGGTMDWWPVYQSDMGTWLVAMASEGVPDIINDMVIRWNAGDRLRSAICEAIATSELQVEDCPVREWTSDVWDVTFDDVVWIKPKLSGPGVFLSDHYEEVKLYSGQYSYHHHHGQRPNQPVGEWKGHRIGIELEVEGKSESSYEKMKQFKSNWFYQERDGSLGSYGNEFITIPLLPKDAKSIDFWRPFTQELSTLAWSWKRQSCGLHVHIGRECLGKDAEQRSETLGKLLFFYHHLIEESSAAKEVNNCVFGRATCFHQKDGKTDFGNAVQTVGKSILKDKEIKERLKQAMISKNNGDRYYDINLMNNATIEFRKGKGSISPERITAIVAWCEGMVEYCKRTAWTSLSFTDYVDWIRARRGTPISLLGFLNIDA